MRRVRVLLRRGCLERQRAGALITSANDSLVGNDQPAYWRFESRSNVDGALRAAAGDDLAAACLELEPVANRDVRRDVIRWTGGVKRGASAPVRCPTGQAVATKAFGRLEADHVVHAVAPDIELSFGRYTGVYEETDDDRSRLPEELLRDAYSNAFTAAQAAGASTVACPALGCGVKGWTPAVSAAFGLDAAVRSGLDEVAFVLGDDAHDAWLRAASHLLAPPPEPLGPEVAWTVDISDDDARRKGDVLRVGDLAELRAPRATWATDAAGTQTGGDSWRWRPDDVRAVR